MVALMAYLRVVKHPRCTISTATDSSDVATQPR
jgi:hypothetical protein